LRPFSGGHFGTSTAVPVCVGSFEKQEESGTKKRADSAARKQQFPFPPASKSDTKGVFMKSLRSILFALTVLLMATAAQAQETRVRATMPFDFVVADHAYPAGEYELKSMLDSGALIRLNNVQEAATGIALSYACTSNKLSSSTKLVFHRVGDRYFLYQIWHEGRSSGREFPVSHTERQLAQNHEKPELVIVAANIE
jgi:hypothetical protein